MISLRGFSPLVQSRPILPALDLDIGPGEIVAVLGASGTGKTSLLQALSGDREHQGTRSLQGRTWSVFQNDHQLFPWITVCRNLDLACSRPWRSWAQRWNLLDLAERKPQYLSVGQRQRFTVLRAACSGSDILLCDEPLSAVDGLGRLIIAQDIRDMAHEIKIAMLWVTHDLSEAATVADRCVVIAGQRIEILHQSTESQLREVLFA